MGSMKREGQHLGGMMHLMKLPKPREAMECTMDDIPAIPRTNSASVYTIDTVVVDHSKSGVPTQRSRRRTRWVASHQLVATAGKNREIEGSAYPRASEYPAV